MFFEFASPPYVAVIGDLVGSKSMQERSRIQSRLTGVLEDVNRRYGAALASRFMITLGDEFQGLLNGGAETMSILTEIEAGMLPVPLRFGVGIGEIATEINPLIPLGADGAAYHHARRMVSRIKDAEGRNRAVVSRILIGGSPGENEETLLLINGLLALCNAIRSRWSPRQREVVFDLLVHNDNQVRAAERLGINQPSIQKSLASAQFYPYKHALDLISRALSEVPRHV